jgi:hypothetical protein
MRRTKEHFGPSRNFEDKILIDRSLIRTRPVSNIKRELKPQLIAFLKHRYRDILIGEVIETKSDSHYVIRKITKEGLEASPLGEYRSDRPHIVTLPNDANGRVADKKKIVSRHKESYRKILLEINEEGGSIKIPLENNGLFDLS